MPARSRSASWTRRAPLVEVSLTDRERDVLAWAAHGKTVPETAIILSVSEDTVVTHMRNAMRKLGSEPRPMPW